MSWIDNMAINIFPMILAVVVLLSNSSKYRRTKTARVFNLVIIFDFLLMLTDVVGMAAVQEIENLPARVVWLVNVTRFIWTTAVTSTWFIYVCCKLRLEKNGRRMITVAAVSAGIVDVAVLLVPYRHLAAYGLANADRVMRVCYLGVSIFGMVMFTLGGAAAAYRFFREKDKDARRECAYLVFFSILPVIGIELQNINQQLRTASACVSIAILYVYVSMQNKHVITDGLTGVNNRREFDAYLERRGRQQAHSDWGILMIDVDDFKIINDEIGHKEGDDALWNVADILKRIFKTDDVFIARYGGDEFVVCGDWDGKARMDEIEQAIRQRVEAFNGERQRGYKLSLSVGGALWSECGSCEAMLEAADKKMYEVKQLRKERRKSDCECGSIYTG